MRRRPMEFWWIAAYCLARSVLLLAALYGDWKNPDQTILGELDRVAIFVYAFTLFFTPVSLFSFQPAGRWISTIVLGIEATDMTRRMAEGVEIGTGAEPAAVGAFAVSLWLNLFLQRPSTASLFKDRSARADAALSFSAGFEWFSVIDLCVAVLAGWAARMSGAPVWVSISAGLSAYMIYGIFFEEALRLCWDSFFARIEPNFPESDARTWRLGCSALASNNLIAARTHFKALSLDARGHSAGRLFEMALEWHELLSRGPLNGRDALRRCVFDYEYDPADGDRKRLTKHAKRGIDDDFALLASERAEFLDALVVAAKNPASFFRPRADRMLTRITGETFAFNAPGSWAAWWQKNREHWTGDAGPVALVARLMYRNCHDAAVDVARKIAGRAEEPLLTELTDQMRFFHSMRLAAQGVGGPVSFMEHPLHVMMVPEWADASGWLHADSPVLASLGFKRRTIARRLALRPKLLNYAATLWKRYPADLNDDLPWLLPLLSGKNFGVLYARTKFDAWWLSAHDVFVRHARATNGGLDAFSVGDYSTAETQFNAALAARPNDLSARYNLVLCFIKRGSYENAERLLRELTTLEPKEAYWWMALGDLMRACNKSFAARSAYRHAQSLGAAEGIISMQLGLTYAHESRDSEAMQLFERALGSNPTSSNLEALATQLEHEGCWKLAGHYREEAMRRELDGPGDFTDDGERGDEVPF